MNILNNFINLNTVNMDIAYPWQLTFQDPGSFNFFTIVEFHNLIVFYLTIVSFMVFWLFVGVLFKFSSKSDKLILTSNGPLLKLTKKNISSKYLLHGDLIEVIWTLMPCVILIIFAIPSFNLLYMSDEIISPAVTIKAVGHQWYWSYEYTDVTNEDGEGIQFDSYLVPTDDLEEGQFRLMDVDTPLVLPIDMYIRFVVTSVDVIHDFAVPALGLKIDATPGRLNQVSTNILRPSHFYGFCSELCGAYHGFMPIHIHAVKPEEFVEWVKEQLE